MFNPESSLPYELVQIDGNKNRIESFIQKYIYKFFVVDRLRNRLKYIAIVKTYPDSMHTIEYYPKVRSNSKYRMLTNQFKFGPIGVTILNIIGEHIETNEQASFGAIASSLLTETTNFNNRRLQLYKEILDRKIRKRKYNIFVQEENSHIFVIPSAIDTVEQDKLKEAYGKILAETN